MHVIVHYPINYYLLMQEMSKEKDLIAWETKQFESFLGENTHRK